MEESGQHLPVLVKGTCSAMCSRNEFNLRVKEKILHPFELKEDGLSGDPERAVKLYSRPSAGQKPPLPSDIRTLLALKKTTNYLLSNVMKKDSVEWTIVYDFIFNRLRAVRQDIVMQGIDMDCIGILEVIILFYSYAGYRLCEAPIEKFDPKDNFHHLSQCLVWLLTLYDADERTHRHRNHFEALNLVVNLGKVIPLTRILTLPEIWKSPIVNLVYHLSLAALQNNFVRVSKLVRKLPVWLACIAILHMPMIRKKALQTMSIAYSSRNLKFPCFKMTSFVMYDSVEDVVQDCKHFNLNVENYHITFDRQMYNEKAKALSPRHEPFVDKLVELANFNDFIIPEE